MNMADSVAARILENPLEYYGSFTDRPHLKDKFHDIDDETHFRKHRLLLQRYETQNFVLDFGNDDAWCALNLEEEDFIRLLRRYRPGCFGTRWINIWSPEEQKDTIKAIMSHYGVSERLQGLMCTEPVKHSPNSTAPSATQRSYSQSRSLEQTLAPAIDDIEGAYSSKDTPEGIAKEASLRNLSFAQVVNQIWHFCSVDHGPKYTCIGYNSLYVIPDIDSPNGKALPEGLRLWSWLVLFEDGTVVSIQENPFPKPPGTLLESEVKPVLEIVRRNVRSIFDGVSKQHAVSPNNNPLVTIRVRHFNDSGPDQASIKQEDGSSLLFYYIFDDWFSSYGLIAKREHKYGVRLDHLREKMLNRPVVELVNELHWLGRRLAVLKRLYQSYELIMMRILQRQRLLRDEAARSPQRPTSLGNIFAEPEPSELRQSTLQSQFSFANFNDTVGVQLSSTAVARFERLLDRIKLYCLTEIDACLTEKESLTFLNFNLIALKDTQAVEKLTRITILLAKVTILFLPVSLMTAYFSTELKGVKGVYTTDEYWISFAVIMVLSMLLLALFGFASDTVEGRPIYRSLIRTFVQNSRNKFTRRRGPRN